MFRKKDTVTPEGFDTLVGANTIFEGNILSDGTVRIDGKVRGDIRVSGDVIVGEAAVITGNVEANNIHLSGTVEGNINAKGMLRILSTAKLFGDIQINSFVADEGAVFQGKCCMLEIPETDTENEKPSSKKLHSSKDYKKSSVITQMFDEKGSDLKESN